MRAGRECSSRPCRPLLSFCKWPSLHRDLVLVLLGVQHRVPSPRLPCLRCPWQSIWFRGALAAAALRRPALRQQPHALCWCRARSRPAWGEATFRVQLLVALSRASQLGRAVQALLQSVWPLGPGPPAWAGRRARAAPPTQSASCPRLPGEPGTTGSEGPPRVKDVVTAGTMVFPSAEEVWPCHRTCGCHDRKRVAMTGVTGARPQGCCSHGPGPAQPSQQKGPASPRTEAASAWTGA